MKKIVIEKDRIVPVFTSEYINVADLQFAEGRHYYDVSRRPFGEFAAAKTDDEFKAMLPDAVSCAIILAAKGKEDRLLLTYEYRYPVGRFLLSPPAGLIDPEDRTAPDPLKTTAVREIREETGLEVGKNDDFFVVNPIVFSSPGMTDESNALVGFVLYDPDESRLTQENTVGLECFDGFRIVTKSEAEKILKNGKDEFGNGYSVYTWMALQTFVTGAYPKKG